MAFDIGEVQPNNENVVTLFQQTNLYPNVLWLIQSKI